MTLYKAHKEWCFPRGTLFSQVLVFKNNELCLITGCWCETMNDHQLKWRGKKVKQIDTVSLDIAGKLMGLHTCCHFTTAVKHIFSHPEDTSQQGNDVQVKSLKSCYGLAD